MVLEHIQIQNTKFNFNFKWQLFKDKQHDGHHHTLHLKQILTTNVQCSTSVTSRTFSRPPVQVCCTNPLTYLLISTNTLNTATLSFFTKSYYKHKKRKPFSTSNVSGRTQNTLQKITFQTPPDPSTTI